MKLVVETELDCPPEMVWGEVRRCRLLKEVCAPLVTFAGVPGQELPEVWPAGGTIRVRSYLFGVVPLGTRTLHFDRVDPVAREIATREHDPLVRRWDHIISVRPVGNGRTRYRDEIDIAAGLLTPLVWAFAWCLYHHRQRRWRRVAKQLALTTG